MVHIFFVSGSFGSTINLVVQNFCSNMANRPEYDLNKLPEFGIRADGSAHTYQKAGHWDTIQKYQDFFAGKIDQNLNVSTPVYDIGGQETIGKTIKMFYKNVPKEKVVFIYTPDLYYAEINFLARYYKIAVGYYNKGLEYFGLEYSPAFQVDYGNKQIRSCSDLDRWELRDRLSRWYFDYINEWTHASSFAPNHWYKFGTDEILNNTRETFAKICNIVDTLNESKLDEFNKFVATWRSSQQYMIDELNLVYDIMDSIINDKFISWEQSSLCVFSEAMLQKKLFDAGYELLCHNLNQFPTNTEDLHYKLRRIE